jgi:putative hydrolase of the HAD superfamily
LSDLPLSGQHAVVFDLDDTLYSERDFVASGFRAVAQWLQSPVAEQLAADMIARYDAGHSDPIGWALQQTDSQVDKRQLISRYREHFPRLQLDLHTRAWLCQWHNSGRKLGILTDGRSLTQRQKIAALGIDSLVDLVVISSEIGREKPHEDGYCHFERAWPQAQLVYVGDNLAKDFVTPNARGWMTIGLADRGHNVHPQSIGDTPATHLPRFWVERLA